MKIKDTKYTHKVTLLHPSGKQVTRYTNKPEDRAIVLMENGYMGRTEQFTEVKFDKEQNEGSIVLGKITDANEKQLFATAI